MAGAGVMMSTSALLEHSLAFFSRLVAELSASKNFTKFFAPDRWTEGE